MFGRARRWLRRHETLVDAGWVVPLVALCLLWIPTYTDPDRWRPMPLPAYVAGTLVLLLPLVVRRRFPLGVFAVVALLAAVHLLLHPSVVPAYVAVVVAMYTVASHRRFGWALVALGATELGLAVLILREPFADGDAWKVVAFYGALVLLGWVTGLYVNVRRRYFVGLEERAESLERERDARAQAAIAEERTRIARELHDVVAHNVSVMVIQTDGALLTLDSDPARARGALETVSETGREALTEMRDILGALRDGEGERRPRSGVDQLDQLVERVGGAGLPVELTVEGEPRPVPTGVGFAAYRVVQEALTNTLKHAGPAVGGVRVVLRYADEALEVRVVDDGRGPSAGDPQLGEGHGLIGMRERVSVYGGSVRAGPGAGCGFEVVASLPLEPVTR